MLKQWINPKYLDEDKINELRKEFDSAELYKHFFLSEEKALQLNEALSTEEFYVKDSDLFSLKQTNDLSESGNELLKSFYLLVNSKEFSEFAMKITGISVKPGAINLAGSLYQSGDYLLCHDDQIEERKIAYILYLSEDFTEEEGAEFNLFENENGRPTKSVKNYPPKFNGLMMFEVSPISFHSVGENISEKDRVAIGGWLH